MGYTGLTISPAESGDTARRDSKSQGRDETSSARTNTHGQTARFPETALHAPAQMHALGDGVVVVKVNGAGSLHWFGLSSLSATVVAGFMANAWLNMFRNRPGP